LKLLPNTLLAAFLFACAGAVLAADVVEAFAVPAEQRLCPISKLDVAGMREADLSPLSDAERQQFIAMLDFHQFLLDSGLQNYCLIQLQLPGKVQPEVFISKSDYDAIFTATMSESDGDNLKRRVKLSVEELVDGENRAWKGSDVQLQWVGRVQ
jgi:hypothetical protein